MKTLILSACSIFAASAAPQSTPQTAVTAAVPRTSEDTPRTLKLIDLRGLLKSDAASTTFGTYTMVMSGRSKAASAAKESATAEATAAPAKGHPDDAELIAKGAVEWQDMLVHWMPPALLGPQDKLQVTRDGTLIANLSAEAHTWLDHFLGLQREPKSMVSLQVDFITGPRGAFDLYFGDRTGNGTANGTPCMLAPDTAQQLLAEAKPGGPIKRLSSALVGWVRAKNNVSMLNRSNYIQDWTITTVEPGRREIAVPVIGTVEEGHRVDLRAVPLDATHVGLELDATQSTVKQPIATQKVKLDIDGGREEEIALPEVTKVGLKGQISLEYGGYALFAGMNDNEDSVAVLVHIERTSATSPPVFQETIMAAPRKKGAAPEKH
jgi:hypothetical protein